MISHQRVKKIDLFNESENLPFKIRKLYDIVKSENYKNEDDLIEKIYGTKQSLPAFRKLKNRLKSRLLNTLFFIDYNQKNFTSYRKTLHSISRNYFIIKILIDRTEREVAMKIAEKTFRLALKYEITEFSYLLARELLRNFAFIQPNSRKHKYYQSEVSRLNAILNKEIIVEKYYCEISSMQAGTKEAFSPTVLERYKEYCDEIEEYQKTISTYRLNLDAYQLRIYYLIKTKRYDDVIILSREALEFFNSKPFDDKLSKYLIKNDIILSSIQLKNHQLASRYIEENIQILTRGSFNWFKLLNYDFLNSAIQERYDKMLDLVSRVINSKQLVNYQIHHQSWLIKEAYIHFLIKVDLISGEMVDEHPLRPFRLNRFLNEVPIFSKDKRGLNIAILIIQLLFLIEKKDYNAVIDRIDALKQYSYRYLRNDSTYRSNCFIKMLIKVPEADFHHLRVERYTKSLFNKLIESNYYGIDSPTEIEVIPFEKLWGLVLGTLEKQIS